MHPSTTFKTLVLVLSLADPLVSALPVDLEGRAAMRRSVPRSMKENSVTLNTPKFKPEVESRDLEADSIHFTRRGAKTPLKKPAKMPLPLNPPKFKASGLKTSLPSNLPLKAPDLKTSTYRRTALKHNKGAYVAAAGGKVKWDPKGKGDAETLEHIIEPGSHIKPVMNQLNLGKNDPLVKDVKKVINHQDNLSMLDPAANKAKAQLTVDPSRKPKAKSAANDYMSKKDVQDKAALTMKKLEDIGKKHNNPQFVQEVKKNVNKNFPNARRSMVESLEDLD
ncbi:hypothetical protein C8J56DRAFT_882158 [Mycena floridula]|nr:hypothetical protein C8J56DRAFT_882158 [Mycena floridula]